MGNAATLDIRERADAPSVAVARTASIPSIPWYVWCLTAATAADLFGGYWDISWHISIGRDTFWTPAHMMIYLAGVLAGVASGYAILTTTFGLEQAAKDASVSVWGFRGPLGCFMAAWGGFAMLTSAPFDNWWHNAYGLDVKIVSLPHSILGMGELMIELGAMLLVCANLNRASGLYQRKLDRLLLLIGGIEVAGSALFILESTPMEFTHNSEFYRAVAAAFPVTLIAIASVSRTRWPATTMAAIYTVLFLAGLWIFPLFPAAPKLGPVYQNITHMVPLWFPVLLIVPAFALDLLRAAMGEKWGGWRSALAAGCVFIAAFVAVQWPFANFMVSPYARNPIFGANYFGFFDPAGLLYNPYRFDLEPTGAALAKGMAIALVMSIIFCSLGMALGNWMRTVRR
jgi:hypothetical protein